MADKLPKTGVQAVVEGAASFFKDIGNVNKSIEQSGKVAQKAASQSGSFSSRLNSMGLGVDSLAGKFAKLPQPIQGALGGMEGFTGALSGVSAGTVAAAAGVAALATAFVALGTRGASFRGLGESFDRLTNSVGVLSQTLLKDLRAAAAGTVSDFSLIQKANLALAGATGEFGKQFGANLPKILENARVQARATGQDVDFLFNSLITGIKRGSPLLIDNTGLVLKIGDANKAYAEQLGKTVEQLTAEEKQIAILNATLAAGEVAITTLGNAQETAAEKMARGQATITNTLDTLALAVQPAFEMILDTVNRVFSMIQQVIVAIAPIITDVTSGIAANVSGFFNDVLDAAQPFINLVTGVLPYLIAIGRAVAGVVQGILNFVGQLFAPIVQTIQSFFGQITSPTTIQGFFEGGARMIGALANGILAAANQLVLPAVISIARAIADFLVGMSPPPKGPLSKIDQGGANVMTAWLGGFTGVSLDPVKQVAAEVSLALGDIGKASIGQVEARLKALDKALLPFSNRLEIAKANFEAINTPAQEALSAIDRQINAATEALMRGDAAAIETIKNLELQRAAIQANVDAQQSILDRAQIQYALAQSQQAQERALLNIRKAQLAVANKATSKATSAAGRDKAAKAPAGGGAGDVAATPELGGGVGIGALPASGGVLDLLGGEQAIIDAGAVLEDAFLAPLQESGELDKFAKNTALLGNELSRLGAVDIGGALKGKFEDFVKGIFDPDTEGSPASQLKGFIDGIVNPEREGSIPYAFNTLGTTISNLQATLGTTLATVFGSLFDPEVEGSALFAVKGFLQSILDPATEGSIPYMFAQLPEAAATAAAGLWTELDRVVFAPVRNFLTNEGEGTLSGILNTAVSIFGGLPAALVGVLQGIGATLYGALVLPIIGVLNGLIQAAETTIQRIATEISNVVSSIIATLIEANLGVVAEALGGFNQTIRGFKYFRIGRISTALPLALQGGGGGGSNFGAGANGTASGGGNPAELQALANLAASSLIGGATGGMFSGGMMRVGENGEEIISTGASKLGVFPNSFVTAIEALTAVLAQPMQMPLPMGGYNTTNNTDNSINATFNGVQGGNDVMRRLATARAYR